MFPSHTQAKEISQMATYRYEVKDGAGKVTVGTTSAASLSEAGQQLRDKGMFVVSLAPVDEKQSKKGFNFDLSFGPGLKDVHSFTVQLAVMIRAGISIRAAIEGIA